MTAPDDSDRQQLHKIAQGDRVAFEALLEHHLGGVRQYLMTLVHNRAIAEEISQEVFLKVWLNAADYEPKLGKLSTWIYRIAHNQFVDQMRKPQQRIDANSINQSLETPAETTESLLSGRSSDPFNSAAALAWVQGEMQELPLVQRSALALRYFSGYSNQQCAQVLGVTEHAVEALLGRAKKTLRKRSALANLESKPHTTGSTTGQTPNG